MIFKFARRRTPSCAVTAEQRALSGVWLPVAKRRQSLFGPTAFQILNTKYDIGKDGWDAPSLPKLLQYNLHYFDDLNSHNANGRRKWHHNLINDWIAENSPARGSGWEPYPTSLRITNWIKWTLSGGCLTLEAKLSLVVQTRWLTHRLEWHLLGNHLFINAKALVFSGLFFEGPEAQKWLAQGLKILAREVPEQILLDGGQFELSPMYHALALEDMLDLANIAQAFYGSLTHEQKALFSDWRGRIPAMLHWLETLSHPDGRIAFFNDASFGVAPENSALFDYARRLEITATSAPLTHLPNSGYSRLELGTAVVLADVAPVGPDYLPAHAHADSLSFEMSLKKKRVIVNSGTSVYGVNKERHRQRGTRAHSTLCLANENSSEVWGGFRVGRRARVSGVSKKQGSEALKLTAQHDGYCHLPGRPRHRRTWCLEKSSLTILDDITGANLQPCDIRFHLAPEIHAEVSSQGTVQLSDGRGSHIARVSFTHKGTLSIESSTWHPEFGKAVPNLCISIRLIDNAPYNYLTTFEWNEK
jgi:uncharacterized heparinase superfamily protein